MLKTTESEQVANAIIFLLASILSLLVYSYVGSEIMNEVFSCI